LLRTLDVPSESTVEEVDDDLLRLYHLSAFCNVPLQMKRNLIEHTRQWITGGSPPDNESDISTTPAPLQRDFQDASSPNHNINYDKRNAYLRLLSEDIFESVVASI
jgi:hypothetical protein